MIAVAVAALLAALAPAAAGGPSAAAVWVGQQAIPSDALAKDAAARTAWHAAARRYARTPWVYDFRGPSSPTRIMIENGRAFAVGAVCKPHDCGDNILAFVLAPGGAYAAGAILHMDGDRKLSETYFGRPTPRQHEWLRARLWEGRR